MLKIKKFSFPVLDNSIKDEKYGQNWPVVYLLENGKDMYVGETYNLHSRAKQHQENPEKSRFKNLHMIADSDFNKSATLDIESTLIRYVSADEKFVVTNKNDGMVNSNYYQRDTYQTRITEIWKKLQKVQLASKDIIQIENSELFKFSPYKALSEDQMEVAEAIKNDIIQKNLSGERGIYFINGLPGSGKTVLATYLSKYLVQSDELKDYKLRLVISMTSLRKTLQHAFKYVKGLKKAMVIGPSSLHRNEYDILLVDEAHRLRRRKGIVNYNSFDKKNLEFGLTKEGTELDWILLSTNHLVIFYDENQSVRPSDIPKQIYSQLKPSLMFTLQSQFRIKAGMAFVYYIRNIFNHVEQEKQAFEGYDVKIYDSFKEFTDMIHHNEDEFGLSRIVSGYAYPWISKKNKKKFDINIDGIGLQWNSVTEDWIYSKNAAYEVGCIHTVQGYDLNYVGVIISDEIDYDDVNKKIIINPRKYFDRNGKSGVANESDLLVYIQNIYITLATRGIKGVYFYVVNPRMKEYLSKYFDRV